MSLIPREPLFVGIEITSESFKIAAIKKRGKGWIFPILQEIPRNDREKLLNLLPKNAILVTSLSSKEILIKNLHIPVKGEKEIRSAFEFQVEPLLPYPLEKSITQYVKIGEKEQGSILTVFSVKKETLQTYIDDWKNLYTCDIDFITAPASALAALSTHFAHTEEPFFLMHIGATEGTIALIEKGALLASHFCQKERVNIEKTILSLSSTYKTKKIDTILLISEEKEWQETLQKITGKGVLYPSLVNLPLSEEHLKKYGLAIGMAIGASLKNFPNFRQKEFRIVFPRRRMKKPLLTLVTLFFVLFSSLFILEKSYLQKKENLLLKKFSSFFSKEAKTVSQLHEELGLIEKQLHESPDLFPLVPMVPKVSEFISWLSSQPSSQNGISIEDLRYHMTKRPDFSKQEERYQVQIEMVFSSQSASAAENMRTLLSSPNPFIDAKKEIEWTIEKGKYKTSFILKDKTPYYSNV